jgi:TonB-dependent SusC/RagA subfamily outer membrane receptor
MSISGRAALLMVSLLAGGRLVAQSETQLAMFSERAPRFFLESKRETVRLDVTRTPVLRNRVSIDMEGARLRDVLDEIARQTGLRLSYSPDIVRLDSSVTLNARGLTIAAALTEILIDANVDVVLSPSGQLSVVRRPVILAGTISGIVTEATTGKPIPQAQVSVAVTLLRRTTADDGRYTIAGVPAGNHTVTVRRLGYDAMSRDVVVRDGETVTLDFALAATPTRLQAVVTTVTGEQRKVELGNNIAVVAADSIARTNVVTNFTDLIMARAPGVLSIPLGGAQLGQSGTMRIRGYNSFSVSNDPIVVVDGVRVEAGGGFASGDQANFNGNGGYTGRLSDLDPNEIESIEIVKGPSAATLYGTDAANGVVLVRTKRGSAGKVKWTGHVEHRNLSQNFGLEEYMPTGYYAFGRSTSTGAAQRCTLILRAAGTCVVDSLTSFNPFNNPDTRPIRPSTGSAYGLQASGGTTSGTTYFLSGDVEGDIGPIYLPPADQRVLRDSVRVTNWPEWKTRPNAYQKLNLRANLLTPLSQRASLSLSTGFISNYDRDPWAGMPDGLSGSRSVFGGWDRLSARPATIMQFRGEDLVRRFLAGVSTNYARDWLVLRGTLGADLSGSTFSRFVPPGEVMDPFYRAAGSQKWANSLQVERFTLDLGATASRSLNARWNSRTSAGFQFNRRGQRGMMALANNLPVGGQTLAGGTVDVNNIIEATYISAVAGGYLEEGVSMNERLFLTGALRLDGASSFGKNFQLATYPKTSVSWIVSNSNVGPRLPLVNELRLRAAYGMSGVQPGPTDALVTVTPRAGLSADGNSTGPGEIISTLGSASLKPERTAELEGGFDLDVAEGRAHLEVTAYEKKSYDALVPRQLAPDVTGTIKRTENLGNVRNRGIEIMLNADVLRTQPVGAGFTATASTNHNELVTLGRGVTIANVFTAVGKQQVVGYPLYGFWGTTLASFADANGNGIIEPTEVTMTKNQFLGSSLPTTEATFAPYITLHGDQLRLSALAQYRGGFQLQPFEKWPGYFGGGNRENNDISTPLSDQATFVASKYKFGFMTKDGSYAILREVSAALSIQRYVARYLGTSDAQLVVAGRNVGVLWTKNDMPFETTNVARDGDLNRIFGGNLPPVTYWIVRLNLNF